MNKLISILTLICFLISAQAQKINILIYTHNGKGYVHKNIDASVTALKKICYTHDYVVQVTDNPSIFSTESLHKFDCIIFANTNNEAFTSEEQKNAFVSYIHHGGGFVGIHSASGSEREWPWFAAMLGGRFVRHPALQSFSIKVIDPNHPSTAHLKENWFWEDECYYLNNLNPDIHVLLAADMNTVVDEMKNEYPGEVFGHYFPLAWCHEFEGGRQFYTALGHKTEHYSDVNFINHLNGGIEWVLATKKQ